VFIGVRVGLGRTLAAEGRQSEALDVLRPALAMSVTQWKPDNWHIAEARLALGQALMATGKPAEAKPLLEQSHATLDRQRRAQPRLAAEADAALARLAGSRHTTGCSRLRSAMAGFAALLRAHMWHPQEAPRLRSGVVVEGPVAAPRAHHRRLEE
jgi:thioredoxin-like negative regulator of GroEL